MVFAKGCLIWGEIKGCEAVQHQITRRTDRELVYFQGFMCEGVDGPRTLRGGVYLPVLLRRENGRWVRSRKWTGRVEVRQCGRFAPVKKR